MNARTLMRNHLGRMLAARRWTDGELATRTGLSRAHLNRLRNRRVRPTLRDGLLISAALGVAVETLFELGEE
jgi:DNA-binding Xre family transcriptional regulator